MGPCGVLLKYIHVYKKKTQRIFYYFFCVFTCGHVHMYVGEVYIYEVYMGVHTCTHICIFFLLYIKTHIIYILTLSTVYYHHTVLHVRHGNLFFMRNCTHYRPLISFSPFEVYVYVRQLFFVPRSNMI